MIKVGAEKNKNPADLLGEQKENLLKKL